jgi:bifunctional enzyme CysN/CysC
MDTRSELRILACGSVDDGKSTLIGRLVNDSAGLFDDQMAALKEDTQRFGTVERGIDFSLLLDGLEAEREQRITIDVAYRFFSTEKRAFVVADAPGHDQYTRNMATGASNAELAIILVDARKGLLEQTKRHAAIVSLLGIRHIVLAVNKIDLVEFSEACFRGIESNFAHVAASLRFSSVVGIPVSARDGDNIASTSKRTPWYKGPSLLEYLETVDARVTAEGAPVRFPVQWVNRPDDAFRGFAGTLVSGSISVGDPLIVESSGRQTHVERIVTSDGDLTTAVSGRAVTITLADEIDVARGDLLVDPRSRPIQTRRFAADLIWMDETSLIAGRDFLLKMGTATVLATSTRLVDALDVTTLTREPCDSLKLNDIGRVWLEVPAQVAFDPYSDNRETGSFILIDRKTLGTAAAGMAIESLAGATNVHRQAGDVTPSMREDMKGQRAMVVWFTGLPGAGKSTIANLVELKLVAEGRQTMLLDGDNLRQGLNSDLAFDAAARSENVRRVGEVAKLMTEAGLIVIVALVSPFRADRDRVAALLPEGRFLEIFVDTPADVCRRRDSKGLYALAERGRLQNLTGRDQPYEAPLKPALILRTIELTPDEAASRVFDLISLPPGRE